MYIIHCHMSVAYVMFFQAVKVWDTRAQLFKASLAYSACIKGSLGVKDSQKLPWDFQKSMPGSLGPPTFKNI